MNNNTFNNINSEEYWENRFATGDWEEKQGREQSLFFYRVAISHFPEWFKEDIKENRLSVCDLGCAEGEGAHLLGESFPESQVTGADISEAALERARLAYPKQNFVKEDINNFKNNFDVIFSSNTLEHFKNADSIMKKLFKSCNKYFALLLPFKEYDRIDEHFFTFDYNVFSMHEEGFNLVFFREIDCTYMENTQWPGKEFLVIYQRCGTAGIDERRLTEIGNAISENEANLVKELNKKTHFLEKDENEIKENKVKIENLNERVEEDRNAIMQIQFEAAQHKQAALDLRETYVWKMGLKTEKLLQKTGIAFIRSLLDISDYKNIGLILTLRKGLNEALHRVDTKHNRRFRNMLCEKKFLNYKKIHEKTFETDMTDFDVPCVKGLISVVLPVFNGEKVIEESIESVLNQSFKNLELIIVNDGSTDKTADIIEKYRKSDSRIRVIAQENKKLPTALSEGFKASKGEFLTWTSADNIMLPDCLKTLAENLERKPDAAMVYGNMRLINKNGRIKRGHFWFEKPIFSGNVCLPRSISKLNTYANNTIGAAFMYRRKALYILEDYSRYKTTLEDYDYWMRMNSLLKISHIDEDKPLYLYRRHSESLTAHDKELGITKNRYKLMVLDDFRRDFYMSSLIWIAETDDENNRFYKDFKAAAENAGQLIMTYDEIKQCETAEVFSCVCYAYFGESFPEERKQDKTITRRVFVSGSVDNLDSDCFDLCITTDSNDTLAEKNGFEGVFYAKDGKTVFSIADAKIKNRILYGLEKMIDDPEVNEKKISIIICTYMRGKKLIDAIWSVIRQSLSKKEYEIIIVDNAPLKSGIREEIEYFKNKYKEYDGFIRYIGVPQKGLSYARNVGMWNAKGEYLTFLDDDILADYYLLEEIYAAFKYHPNVGVVGGQVILDVPFPKPAVLKKGMESLWSQFKITENTFREVSQQFEFPYGANFSVKREAIRLAGGFRMCYGRVGNDFAGGEETALSFKMLQIGYGIGLQPNAKVLHRVDKDRFNTEHVKKTILASAVTSYRFFCDLHTPIGWTERYVKNQIKITEKEIKILKQKNVDGLDIFYKNCWLDAWKRLLEYMKED